MCSNETKGNLLDGLYVNTGVKQLQNIKATISMVVVV